MKVGGGRDSRRENMLPFRHQLIFNIRVLRKQIPAPSQRQRGRLVPGEIKRSIVSSRSCRSLIRVPSSSWATSSRESKSWPGCCRDRPEAMKLCTVWSSSATALLRRRLADVGTQSGTLKIRRSRSFIKSNASFNTPSNRSRSPRSSRSNSVFRAILLVKTSNSKSI